MARRVDIDERLTDWPPIIARLASRTGLDPAGQTTRFAALPDRRPRSNGSACRWRSLIRRVSLGVVLALVATATVLGVQYHRQITSYLTHLKGGPSQTQPYHPFSSNDPPLLRIAVAGDVGDDGSDLDATGTALRRSWRERCSTRS